jgi:hypothetical protein
MRFINREYELGFLNGKWAEPNSNLVIIYGKRRVGKTELCLHFAKEKPHIYFLCDRVNVNTQLRKFAEAIGEFYKDEFISQNGFKDWEMAFKYLAAKKEKIVIIIDEFSYLAEADKSIPSIFQKCWDLYLKNSMVYMILLGSSISMMEQTTLFYKAPLYGRRTGQLLIKPFKFSEVKKLLPEKDFDELLAVYGTVGGTVFYLNYFHGRTYWEVVRDSILQKGAPLYSEVEFLLREELNESRNYFAILESISLGKHKLSEIINNTGFDKGTASRYISILNDIQITKKEIPVTENNPGKSRKGIYDIEDNFFSFWFRFIFKNKRYLEENRINEVVSQIKNNMQEILSKNYEIIANQILETHLMSKKHGLKFDFIGRWWDKDAEIDIVGVNSETNEIIFGETKWSNKKVGTDIFEKLKENSCKVVWGKQNRKEYYCLFSKSGFTSDMCKLAQKENVLLFKKDKNINE